MRLLLFCEHLDDELISEERYSYFDNSSVIQKVSRGVDWTDNGKVIRCIANHIALDRPKESTVRIEVHCKLNYYSCNTKHFLLIDNNFKDSVLFQFIYNPFFYSVLHFEMQNRIKNCNCFIIFFNINV